MKRELHARAWLMLGLLAAGTAAAQQPMLVIDGLKGQASISRDNQTLVAADGGSLQAGDLLFTSAGASIELQLSRYGRLELGSGTQLMIEKLPFSSYASDRHTVVELRGGYLHLVWKHPGQVEDWLLQIDFGSERLSLNSGEFFFDRSAEGRKFCVASGSAVQTSSAVLEGPACYLIEESGAPRKVARSSADFIAMRDTRAVQMPAPKAPLKVVVSEPELAAAAPPPASPSPPPPALGAKPVAPPVPVVVVAKPVAPPPPAPKPEVKAKPEPESKPEPKPEPKSEPAPVTAAAVVASPAQAPVKKAAGTGVWTLNITSESDAKSAKEAIAKLRTAGYSPSVETAQVNGREWYRVQIAGVEGSEAAKALAAEIKAKLGYKEIWVAKKK